VNPLPTSVPQQLIDAGHWRGELIVTDRNGRRLHVEETAVLVRDARGQVVGQVGVSRDITRRKQVEAQNARLLAELTASEEQLRALSRRLVAMQEDERSYVADQLYNQAGQVLAALRLQLARLTKTGDQRAVQAPEIEATLSQAIHELHDLASQLRPVGLDRATLAGVLHGQVLAFGQAHGLAVQFCADNTEALRVSKDVRTAIYRAVQEGLANIARHSGATTVELALARAGDVLTVTLADNGIGFDSQGLAAAGGLGLASIRERLKAVGGRLRVTSGPAGTTLHMEAPLSSARRVA
jgi:signal transduction histidine kinase